MNAVFGKHYKAPGKKGQKFGIYKTKIGSGKNLKVKFPKPKGFA